MLQPFAHSLTAIGCVKHIFTDMCALACSPQGLVLIEGVDGVGRAKLQRLIMLALREAYGEALAWRRLSPNTHEVRQGHAGISRGYHLNCRSHSLERNPNEKTDLFGSWHSGGW